MPDAKKMTLMPVKPGLCVHCATDHREQDPHNFQSLYYGMRFLMEHEREPTHADCVAHLSPERQQAYREVLPKFNVEWTEPESDPINEPYSAR